jgi:hypothetical protein
MSLTHDPPEPSPEDPESRLERIEKVRPHLTPAQRRPRYGQPFFPVTIFGATMYIAATLVALVVLSLLSPAPLLNPADPINHEKYVPRPDWEFLFLFQVLKVFGGPWEIIGTAVIPAIIALLLIGLPFYDRNWSRRAVRRPIAVGSAVVALVALAYLTYVPIAGTLPAPSGGAYLTTAAAHPTFTNVEAIFAKNCQPCHFAVGGYSGNNLHLDSYTGVRAGGSGAGGLPRTVIVPGNARGSYLWQVVEWTQKVGAPMPLGGQKIAQVDRTNIARWIDDGAKGP